MAKSRTKKATAQNRGKAKKKRSAAGKKTPVAKAMTAAQRSATSTTSVLTSALGDAKRTAQAKWAWVERQLKRA
jgi:hypothetical protein